MRSLDAHYFLLHAFDRLGRHLYGDEWDAQEFKATACPSPGDIEAQRAALQGQLDGLAAKIEAAQVEIGKCVNADAIAELKGNVQRLIDEQTELRSAYYRLPQDMNGPRREWERFARRQRAEGLLFQALTEEKLFAFEPGGMRLNWRTWSRARGFYYSLDLSLVRVPSHLSGQRRMAVLLHREEFEQWLRTILPVSATVLSQASPEEHFRAWLHEIAIPSSAPARKEEIRTEAFRKFPGLSHRAFNRIWDATVPGHWKKSGRRKG